MANGKIRFGKQSGGELALVIPDGVANTEVIVPESGVLATKQYVEGNCVKLYDNQAIAGVKTFTSSPIVPTPTTDFQVTTKQYVDSKTFNINLLIDKPTPVNTDNLALQETGGLLKKLSFTNLMAWIKSFSFGWGQTWQNMTGVLAGGVNYTNNTGKPIVVSVYYGAAAGSKYCYVDGVIVGGIGSNSYGTVTFVVPNNSTYQVNWDYGGTWAELR